MLGTFGTTYYIPAEGISLHAETYGSRSADRWIVLLHGGYQSLQCWRHQFSDLARDCYLIVLDLPFHGSSDALPETGDVAQGIVACLRSVLAELGVLSHPHSFLVWSWGGIVLRNYLLTYGFEQLKSILSVASGLGGMEVVVRYLQQDYLSLMADLQILPPRLSLIETFVRRLTYEPLPRQETALMLAYNLAAFHKIGQQNIAEDLPGDASFLSQIRVPVLCIQGTKDAIAPLEHAEHLVRHLPQASLSLYESCGHAPFLENPLPFNAEVRAFLATVC